MNTTGERTVADANGAASLSDRVRGLRLPQAGGGGASGPGRALPWAACAVLLVTTLAFGYRAYRVTPAETVAPAPTDTGSTSKVSTSVAATGDVVLQAKGYVIPAHQVQVSPKVGGMILELNPRFAEGQFFRTGDPKNDWLAKLETVDYKAARDHASANLATARARLEELTRNWDKEIEQVQHELDESKTTLQQMKLDMVRNQRLAGTNAVAMRDYEQAKYGHDAMARRVEKLDVALSLMGKDGPRKEKVKAAQEDVKAAQSDLEKAEWLLSNCIILPPIDGHILTKKAEKGNVVNPLAFNVSASLCEMADLRDLEVDLSIQERDISAISPDPEKLKQVCLIMPEAYQNYEPFRKKHPSGFRGLVSRQMPIADRAKGAVQVRVKVDPGEIGSDEVGLYLKPDMGVLVSFFRAGTVPKETVQTADKKP